MSSPSLYSTPGHLIPRIARAMARWGDKHFQPLGLAIAQMPVLAALKDGDALSQKELIRLAQIEQPTMAQLLTRMERDGLIERTTDPEDKRSTLIRLTPSAMDRLPMVRHFLIEGNAEALKGFTAKEIATLNKLLMRVFENLDPEAVKSMAAPKTTKKS